MTNIIGQVLVILSIETNVVDTGFANIWCCKDTNCCNGLTAHSEQIKRTNVFYRIGTTNGVEVMKVPIEKRGDK